MSDHIKKYMIKRVEGNIKNIHIHTNKQDILKYQQYDILQKSSRQHMDAEEIEFKDDLSHWELLDEIFLSGI